MMNDAKRLYGLRGAQFYAGFERDTRSGTLMNGAKGVGVRVKESEWSGFVHAIVQCVIQYVEEKQTQMQSADTDATHIAKASEIAGCSSKTEQVDESVLYYDACSTNEMVKKQIGDALACLNRVCGVDSVALCTGLGETDSIMSGVRLSTDLQCAPRAKAKGKDSDADKDKDKDRDKDRDRDRDRERRVKTVAVQTEDTHCLIESKHVALSVEQTKDVCCEQAARDLAGMKAKCELAESRLYECMARLELESSRCDDMQRTIKSLNSVIDGLTKQVAGERRKVSMLESSRTADAKMAQMYKDVLEKLDITTQELHNAKQSRDSCEAQNHTNMVVADKKIDLLKHAVRNLMDEKNRLMRGAKATSDLSRALRDRMNAAESKLATLHVMINNMRDHLRTASMYDSVMLCVAMSTEISDAVGFRSDKDAKCEQSGTDSEGPWRQHAKRYVEEMRTAWTKEFTETEVSLFVDSLKASMFTPLTVSLTKALDTNAIFTHVANHTLLSVGKTHQSTHAPIAVVDESEVKMSMTCDVDCEFDNPCSALQWSVGVLEETKGVLSTVPQCMKTHMESDPSVMSRTKFEDRDVMLSRVYDLLSHTFCASEMVMTSTLALMLTQRGGAAKQGTHVYNAITKRILAGATNKMHEDMVLTSPALFATHMVQSAGSPQQRVYIEQKLSSDFLPVCHEPSRNRLYVDRRFVDNSVHGIVTAMHQEISTHVRLKTHVDMSRLQELDPCATHHLCCAEPRTTSTAAHVSNEDGDAGTFDEKAFSSSTLPTELGVTLSSILNSPMTHQEACGVARVSCYAKRHVDVAKANAAAHVRPFAMYMQATEGIIYAAAKACDSRIKAIQCIQNIDDMLSLTSKVEATRQDSGVKASVDRNAEALVKLYLDAFHDRMRVRKQRAVTCADIKKRHVQGKGSAACERRVHSDTTAQRKDARADTVVLVVRSGDESEKTAHVSADVTPTKVEGRTKDKLRAHDETDAAECAQEDSSGVAFVHYSCLFAVPPCSSISDGLSQSFQVQLATSGDRKSSSKRTTYRCDKRGITARERMADKLAKKRQAEASQRAKSDDAADHPHKDDSALEYSVHGAKSCTSSSLAHLSSEARAIIEAPKMVKLKVACCSLPPEWQRGPMNTYETHCHIAVYQIEFSKLQLCVFARITVHRSAGANTLVLRDVYEYHVNCIVVKLKSALKNLCIAEIDDVNVFAGDTPTGRKVCVEKVFMEIGKELCGFDMRSSCGDSGIVTDITKTAFANDLKTQIQKLKTSCQLSGTERLVISIDGVL